MQFAMWHRLGPFTSTLLLLASCGRLGYEPNETEATQTAVLRAPTPEVGAKFGDAIAFGEGRIAIGAPFQEPSGVVYIYRIEAGGWGLEATLTTPDGADGQTFGEAVALDANTLVVGAQGTDAGAYVFIREGMSWEFQTRLGAYKQVGYGNRVSVSGDIALVSARLADVGGVVKAGRVHFYQRVNGNWTEQFVLEDPQPTHKGLFGARVEVDGSLAAISKKGPTSLYALSGTSWEAADILVPSEGDPVAEFLGHSGFDLHDDLLTVSREGAGIGNTLWAGAIHTFEPRGGGWEETSTTWAPEPVLGEGLGKGGAEHAGELMIVGAPAYDERRGRALLYRRVEGQWEYISTVGEGEFVDDEAGLEVAISRDFYAVGVERSDGLTGFVWVAPVPRF